MRGVVLLLVIALPACADERFAERTGKPHVPYEHTAASSGVDRPAAHVQPSVAKGSALGYVNETTFGSDYSLFGRWPGRVFPGWWPLGRKPASYARQYATDGPCRVPDPIAAQPLRRAVKEARAERGPHE